MKINVNGIIREMTPEEIAELEQLAASVPEEEITLEDRIKELETAFNLLLEGVTE